MKRAYLYFLILFAFFAFTAIILVEREQTVVYGIQMRQGTLASGTEWINTKAAIESLIEKVNSRPDDKKSLTALGMAYINEGRISGNHSYYDAAALDVFDKILKEDKDDFLALVGKTTILLSQHHFTDALPIAEHAKKINPHSSAVYGLLTDVYVETGDYEKAIEMADKMSETRPDMRAYSRISYLREIFGDYSGAIDAMKFAVEAGYPGLEQTEWCRYQLGMLYENTGELSKAQNCFDFCIYFRPSFAWAYAGKGRIEKSKRNFNKAIEFVKQAQAILPDFSFQQELTELYRKTNQQQLAAESARKTIEILGGTDGNESMKNHGHYADKELAYAFLDSYDYINARKHALIEYNRRPGNIEVNQALAWVEFKLGNYKEANRYINAALRTNSLNPILNYQAGLIKNNFGDPVEGKRLIDLSIKINPYVFQSMFREIKPILTLK